MGGVLIASAVIMFITSPSIYVVYKIGLYKQNDRGEYFSESQPIRKTCEIRKKISPTKISRYTVVITKLTTSMN